MKKVLKRIVCIFIIFVLPLGFVYTTQVRTDTCTIRLKGFYLEPKNSLDVVFLGQSEEFHGYSPALAYHNTGITSYNYAVPSNIPSMYISELKEILSRQSPQLIVIDITPFTESSEWNELREASFRKYVEGIPLSLNKVDTIISAKGWENAPSYFFPFMMYHGEFENFSGLKDRFSMDLHGMSYLKGILATNYIMPLSTQNQNIITSEECLNIDSENQSHLEELVSYAKSIKNQVVFCRFPHRITSDEKAKRYQRENCVKKFVQKNGFTFLDFSEDISKFLDINNDFCDDEHMNVNGQKKLTKHIAKILVDEFGVKAGEHELSVKENWNKSVVYASILYENMDELIAKFQVDEGNGAVILYETAELINDLEKRYLDIE